MHFVTLFSSEAAQSLLGSEEGVIDLYRNVGIMSLELGPGWNVNIFVLGDNIEWLSYLLL